MNMESPAMNASTRVASLATCAGADKSAEEGDSRSLETRPTGADGDAKRMDDLFGNRAELYALTRPSPPRELLELLASLCKSRRRVWDAGTGSGQAANGLAEFFEEVIATDVSEKQLRCAARRPNINYRLTSCGPLTDEEVASVVGEEGSLDLVTAAQAVHWFHLTSFYEHVRHLLRKPGGVVAVWCYTAPEVNAAVDALVAQMEEKSLPFWDEELLYVRERYRTIQFPFDAPPGMAPVVRMNAVKEASLEGFLAFLESWTTLQRARREGVELLNDDVMQALRSAWGPPYLIRRVTFPAHVRIGQL
ncbi:hypothetical protein KP509_15G068100 [Ceratopteris richardii]|uniref:Methyltransferase type 11 domain-containing protein n=1 Tax=Ceratopteris richardii TaxID=49495 RepID=A0A8T2T4F8_CERRI|nr:hypothetical protein KP509_15G068100 [Ceratopteris richardii]